MLHVCIKKKVIMKIIMIMKDLWRNRIDLIALLCNKSDSGTQSQECIQGKEKFRNPQAKQKNKRRKQGGGNDYLLAHTSLPLISR